MKLTEPPEVTRPVLPALSRNGEFFLLQDPFLTSHNKRAHLSLGLCNRPLHTVPLDPALVARNVLLDDLVRRPANPRNCVATMVPEHISGRLCSCILATKVLANWNILHPAHQVTEEALVCANVSVDLPCRLTEELPLGRDKATVTGGVVPGPGFVAIAYPRRQSRCLGHSRNGF